MATDDDDEPTPAERAHARAFAELVDKTLAGRTPPAVSADDRALLEVATVIRATAGKLELSAPRRSALIEDVLRQAISEAAPPAPTARVTDRMVAAPIPAAGSAPISAPISLASRRRRLLPWAISGASVAVAAAAVAALWLRAPQPAPPAVSTVIVPAAWTSRPADALVGPISRERSGDASARIDDIFADRLDGYRERLASQRGPR